MTGPQLGKEALLDAASLLFDEHGVDAVSLSMINQASGHRNRSAAHYHFGGKEEVVRALVRRAMSPANERRNELLDQLEATTPSPSVHDVLRVAVAPLADLLVDPDGRRYLRLLGQLMGHPRWYSSAQGSAWVNSSLARCAVHLRPAVAHLPDPVRIERVAQISAFITRSFADQATLIDAPTPTRPVTSVETFTANVVELYVAMLAAPAPAADEGAAAAAAAAPA